MKSLRGPWSGSWSSVVQSVALVAPIAFAVLLLGQWLWSRRAIYRLAWQLDGEWSLPFIGHLLNFTNHADILLKFRRMFADSDGVVTLWLGTEMYVLLSHPEDVGAVLGSVHCTEKANIYRMVANRLQTNGLVSSEGAAWRKNRKIIAQGFSESVVTGYMDMFNKHIGDLLVDIDARCGRGVFNLKVVSNVYLMNTVLDTTLGHDVAEEDKHTYEKFFADGQNIISKLVYQPWHQIDLYWRWTRFPALLSTFNRLHNRIFDKLIEQRLEQGCDRLTLIDKLLRIMEETGDINVPNIKSECNTIMMAGSDTSALTVSTTILFLAMYPEHQRRVYDEVDRLLGGEKRALTRAEIDGLKYTDQCIREVMRFTPIVPIIARRNQRPIRLRNGVELPVDTSIVVSINDVHRNRLFWGADADVFRPERMRAEALKEQHPYAWLGFSGGPRNCIGYKYAMVIVKLAVARLVHNYTFQTPLKVDDIRYSVDINIHFLMKHLVEVQRR